MDDFIEVSCCGSRLGKPVPACVWSTLMKVCTTVRYTRWGRIGNGERTAAEPDFEFQDPIHVSRIAASDSSQER
jgi:hypothetical protein